MLRFKVAVMEEDSGPEEKKRRRRCVLLVIVAFLLLFIIVLALGLGLGLGREKDPFKDQFLARCKKFNGYDCEKIWDAFHQAYVNKDPCNVSMEAYDPLIAAAAFETNCDTTLFWSQTKDVAHHFTDKKKCFVTMENTMLGSVLDGLTWCGKKGSSETFTTGCPGLAECVNNSVHSFWARASDGFSDSACGNVTVMLNGSKVQPFLLKSIFASIEVKNFNASKVKNLNVVLVADKGTVSNCGDASLKDLKNLLDKGIQYNCKEIPLSQLEACASNSSQTCGPCW